MNGISDAMIARQQTRHGDGRYAEMPHADPGDVLEPVSMTADRLEQLRAGGYTEPIVYRPVKDTIGAWWADHFAAAEYGASDGDIVKMPDDYTPGRKAGRALSGNRRTHRIRYTGQGAEFRMPSASAIRRFAGDGHRVFDVPVEVTRPDGTRVAGWVRVAGAGHAWTTQALGFGQPSDEAAVAEGVAAILESRRPAVALNDAGNLLDRHRRSRARVGVRPAPVNSGWIEAVGFDAEQSLMVMRTSNGRTYGYDVHRALYQAVAGAASPGRAFNTLVRKKARHVEVSECGSCGRVYVRNPHVCPAGAADRHTADLYSQRIRMVAAGA